MASKGGKKEKRTRENRSEVVVGEGHQNWGAKLPTLTFPFYGVGGLCKSGVHKSPAAGSVKRCSPHPHLNMPHGPQEEKGGEGV